MSGSITRCLRPRRSMLPDAPSSVELLEGGKENENAVQEVNTVEVGHQVAKGSEVKD